MKAAGDKQRPTRPVFIVYEEGHNFAPAGEPAISKNIIKRIAAEGRKFGVGFAIVSQRPSKLDSDVTSQCNTIVAMRIKNPDDQRFIQKTSDYFSAADLDELPTLSTGEALICGRAIIAPLVVKVGTKALIHGGESPRVCERWGRAGAVMTQARTSLADPVFAALIESGAVMERALPDAARDGIPMSASRFTRIFLRSLATRRAEFGLLRRWPNARSAWAQEHDRPRRCSCGFGLVRQGTRARLGWRLSSSGSNAATRANCAERSRTLVIASNVHRGALSLCVLIYWVRSGSAPRSMESHRCPLSRRI